MTAPIQPTPAPMLQPPAPPWTPFQPLPTDVEPLIATMRMRRLSRLIDSAKFETFPPEWQQVAIQEYQRMAQVVAAATPAPPLPKGVVVQGKAGDAATLAAEEKAATNPNAPQQPVQQQPQQPPTLAGGR